MGTLTLAQIKTEIRSNFAGRTDLDDRLVIGINLSQQRIARRHKWEELESTTDETISDTGVIATDMVRALPTNTRDIHSLVVIDTSGNRYQKLRYIDNRLWDRQIVAADQLTRGFPSLYTRWRDKLELYKVQDGSYTLRSRTTVWPTAFASDEAALSDLDEKDDMIIALTTAYFYNSLKKLTEAGRFWAIYVDMLESAIREDNEKPDADMLPRSGVRQSASISNYAANPFVNRIPF